MRKVLFDLPQSAFQAGASSSNLTSTLSRIDRAYGKPESLRRIRPMDQKKQKIELETSVLTAHNTAVSGTVSRMTLPAITGSEGAISERMRIKDCDTRNLSQGLPSYGTLCSNRVSPFYVAGCLEVQVEVPIGLKSLACSIEWHTGDEAKVIRQGQHSIPLIHAQALTTEISLHDHYSFLIMAKGAIARIKLFRYSS
jgi:hypothetical protein